MNFQIVLVLCLYFGTTKNKVVKNFKECSDFFYQKQSPTLEKPSEDMVYICQRYDNEYYYATLYDTKNRIPLYSAFQLIVSGPTKGRRDGKFFIEPNLANEDTNNGNMIEPENSAKYDEKQAIDTDYKDSGYTKGHLNPQMFNTLNDNSKYATNTFTNFAPQYKEFNEGTWSIMEQNLLNIAQIKKSCSFPHAKIYTVVGVQPGNTYITRKIDNQYVNRVNVPEFFWTAICCDTSETDIGNRKRGWSFAYKADNRNESSVKVTFLPVENFLKNQYSNIFADYKGPDGNTIKGCQFNKYFAKRYITQITKTSKKIPIFETNPTTNFDPNEKNMN